MSRALDQDTVSLLNTGTLPQVYADIARALSNKISSGTFLEIEILPKSHPLPDGCNVLVDDNYIGITKSKVVQAFIFARKLLFEYLKDFQKVNYQDILNATAVMLLMDAENLTAANTRKRLIQRCQRESVSELQQTLNQELYWVNSMLTSRLHRHTKSPTLWNHRRWVIEVCQSIGVSHNIQKELEEVVLVAAERHPRNYYAWLHMRWLLQNNHGKSLPDERFISSTQDWCIRHPSDTSGFSFLLFCLNQLSTETGPPIEINSAVCKEVLSLAVSFRWTHESVWVFLRTLIASGEVRDDQRAGFFKGLDDLLTSLPENSKPSILLKTTQEWCNLYERRPGDISITL